MYLKYLDIFVGRENDINTLDELFEGRTGNKNRVAKVFSYLNAPGVGKTTLLSQFGKKIEKEGKGIHIAYSCTKSHKTEEALVKNYYYILGQQIDDKIDTIETYIKNLKGRLKKIVGTRFDKFYEEINTINTFNFSNLVNTISALRLIIPVFLSTDEIQRLEDIKLGDKTLLHSYAVFISDILNQKILLVISGTQYHILSKIGHGIGSPLNGKIKSVVIGPLKQNHINEYLEKLLEMYPDIINYNELKEFIFEKSGGHPRTIEFIVDANFNKGDSNLLLKIKELLRKSILDTDKKDAIKALQSDKNFEFIKKWMIKGLDNNLKLGSITSFSDEQENIVFQLMTIGIVVQNGNSNYYLTSYFHILTFLDALIGEYETFLHQIVQNKYFAKIVGGHSGLGYTFETILFASLLVKANNLQDTPYSIAHLNDIEINKTKLSELPGEFVNIKENTIYHTPSTKAVDGFFKIDDQIILVQIATGTRNLESKIIALENVLNGFNEFEVKGWFISLFDTEYESDKVIISQNKDLRGLLGKNILDKMKETKKFKI